MDNMRKLIKESGIRDINNIAKRYKKAKIYFHQDLDGVTTALAMKNYLEQQGIEVVDAEVIQYGDKEFSIKKADAQGEVMPVLVDFAHGKPMFVIHTDHHDTQAGAEETQSTSFRHSRSNVETISQLLSPKEIFPSDDIMLISIVDSANFASNEITPEMVMNYLFKYDKEASLRSNKMMMGLVTNKLLLAFKNKPRFLEEIVLNAKPSLLSILNNIRKQVDEKGYAKPEELVSNQASYIEKQKQNKQVQRVGNIIVQYGGGSMTKAGSYDRYTPFKNNPDADFIVIAWPLGLVQASCNPFKQERALKGVDLGEMKNEVLSKFENELKGMTITFGTLKRISETKADYQSVGFTFKDMLAIYGKLPSFKINGNSDNLIKILENVSSKLFKSLSDKQKELLDKVTINGWDIIQANSGGHKCITNISGMSFLYSKRRKDDDNLSDDMKLITYYKGNNRFVKDIQDKLSKFGRLSDKQVEMALDIMGKETKSDTPEITSYVELTKAIQQEFVNVLNEKIEKGSLNESKNETKKYYIDDSKIKNAGKGVFAKKDLKKGERIGLLHTINKLYADYDFTELGGMHNHSGKPTCHNEKVGNKRYLVASKDLKKGEELTTNYRLQPDLEQPKKDWGSLNENKMYKPEVDGYRTYSPFKNLPYIIVNGNAIDCNNIVHDLILLGDNKKIKYCKKNSGIYTIKGANNIVEIPVQQGENIKDIFKDSKSISEWIRNRVKKIDKNGEIKKMFF